MRVFKVFVRVFPIKGCLLVKFRKSWFDSKEIKRTEYGSNAGLLVESQNLKLTEVLHYILNSTYCIFPRAGEMPSAHYLVHAVSRMFAFPSGMHFLVNDRNDALSAISHNGLLT